MKLMTAQTCNGRAMGAPHAEITAVMAGKRRGGAGGFTLVEVMVVVVIAGVLALIGMNAMDKHLAASRSGEAKAMVQSIRAAQERYRAMTGLYLDVSTEGGFYPRDPTGTPGTTKTAFFYPVGGSAPPDNGRWLELGPTVTGGVQYGYVVRAGLPGQTMPALRFAVDGVVWPVPNEPWYVIEAIGDTDGDGRVSHFVATSLNGELYSENEGE